MSLCCILETNILLYVNYTSIFLKKESRKEMQCVICMHSLLGGSERNRIHGKSAAVPEQISPL